MKIALYDMDQTGFPNLALCKLAAFYRSVGHTVEFNPSRLLFKPDREMGSRVFSWSPPIENGVYTSDKLEDYIEHTCPDTSDYDVDPTWAYGFTSRGCPRRCDFCAVWKTEGNIKAHAQPSEFVLDHHNKVFLLDNNWLASPTFEETATWLADRKIEVDPNQGLDIRLITDSKAKILRQLKFKIIRFAFDNMDYKDKLIEGVSILRHWKVKPARYQAYLIHFPGDDILDRIKVLEGLYVDPFVMPYVHDDGSREQSDVARWANAKPIFRSTPWEQYDKTINNRRSDRLRTIRSTNDHFEGKYP